MTDITTNAQTNVLGLVNCVYAECKNVVPK